MTDTDSTHSDRASWLDRALGVFGDVRAGEGGRALLLGFNLFLLLSAYYVIKTVREPMILADGSAELKSYAAAGQALTLMVFVPLYSWFASRVDRRRLIVGITLFFVLCLQAFYVPARNAVRVTSAQQPAAVSADHVASTAEAVAVDWAATHPDRVVTDGAAEAGAEVAEDRSVALRDFASLGFIFYVWVGIFSLAMIAQFWSLANDLYTRGAGDRIFPLIGVGATLGGAFGSKVASVLFDVGVKVPGMLQVASALLVVHLALSLWAARAAAPDSDGETPSGDDAKMAPGSGFTLVLKSSYIRLIAAVILLLNLVNTTGEYILGRMVKDEGLALLAAGEINDLGAYIGGFYGDFFSVVNVLTVLVQALLVSRIVKYVGLAGVVLALPVIATGAYGLMAAGVGLAAVRWAKTAENTTDYSVMNTAKAMLWLPTSREEKYKAKQAVDTFFVRLGDLGHLALVVIGTEVFAWSVQHFAAINLVIIVLWLALSIVLLRRYYQLASVEADAPRGWLGRRLGL